MPYLVTQVGEKAVVADLREAAANHGRLVESSRVDVIMPDRAGVDFSSVPNHPYGAGNEMRFYSETTLVGGDPAALIKIENSNVEQQVAVVRLDRNLTIPTQDPEDEDKVIQRPLDGLRVPQPVNWKDVQAAAHAASSEINKWANEVEEGNKAKLESSNTHINSSGSAYGSLTVNT